MTVTVGITGGTGFIGKKIVDNLVEADVKVISLQRLEGGAETVPTRIFDLSNLSTINTELLEGIDIVIHTAALVHNSSANQAEHETLNRYATSKLISVSMKCNIKKFIFISTVGVYGVSSQTSSISLETSVSPQTPYAKAKRASEIELLKNASSEMKVSIFRLPLVIGKNAPGNYGFLEKISKTKFPLPFGLIANRRSVVTVDVAAKVITEAAKNLTAYEGLHLVAETPPVSTKDLIVGLRKNMGLSHNLLPIPKLIMKLILLMIGKRKVYEQLYENLVFESTIKLKKYIKSKNE